MAYRTRLLASLPGLLRRQQGPGIAGRPRDTAGLTLPVACLQTPFQCRPCRRMFGSSSEQPHVTTASEQKLREEKLAKKKKVMEKRLRRDAARTANQTAQLPDGTEAKYLALAPDQLGRLVGAEEDGSQITLSFEHKCTVLTPACFSTLWFRDACPCPRCVSETSGQKKFATCDIDPEPQLESVHVTRDGDLSIRWENDFLDRQPHVSVYPLDFLQRAIHSSGAPHNHWRFIPGYHIWDANRFTADMDARFIDYEDWMAGSHAFAKAFQNLASWGLVFMRGVPESHDAVRDIASKIGDLQRTFYGDTWDVISKPNAENVAYTNEFLGLHQDLLYWNTMPKLQLLHCLKNECEGGDSLFSDGLRTAWDLKTRQFGVYKELTQFSVGFQYTKNGHFYYEKRHTIDDSGGIPVGVNWSPPFQAPFRQNPMITGIGKGGQLREWHAVSKMFKNHIESSGNMLRYRLQPGECVLFDNQRILHGRTQFDTSAGHRHLRGGYIDEQTLASATVRLGEQGALGALAGKSIYTLDKHGNAVVPFSGSWYPSVEAINEPRLVQTGKPWLNPLRLGRLDARPDHSNTGPASNTTYGQASSSRTA